MSSTEFEFTSEEEIGAFNDGDKSMELLGFVDAIDGLKELKTSQKHLFKFVLNNNSGVRMRVLVWVIRITGGTVKMSNPNFRVSKENVNFLEFHVQSYSTMEILGNFLGHRVEFKETFRSILFDEVMIIEGDVETEGYLKVPFVEVTTPNSKYAQGIIVDGFYRLTVQIALFMINDKFVKGAHLRLRGEMNKEAGCFKIKDMGCIDLFTNNIMAEDKLKSCIHSVTLVRTKRPSSSALEGEKNSKKKCIENETEN
ncbi:uncharacterized protein LOC122504787 [Leptopilina heterotoma]|uniref:uncharacterized protein LOC122504787 n=1 Tax=Leptopilina heterotoma TaxID=63436 RepID=UPI001CA839B1|nr:uncharacterized protein LOC122504787 [Leptopilina heterotoma]